MTMEHVQTLMEATSARVMVHSAEAEEIAQVSHLYLHTIFV